MKLITLEWRLNKYGGTLKLNAEDFEDNMDLLVKHIIGILKSQGLRKK